MTYEPEVRTDRLPVSALNMRRLVEEARLALNADLSKMDADDALRDMLNIMASPIDWAPGLLLKGDGYRTDFYKKE